MKWLKTELLHTAVVQVMAGAAPSCACCGRLPDLDGALHALFNRDLSAYTSVAELAQAATEGLYAICWYCDAYFCPEHEFWLSESACAKCLEAIIKGESQDGARV